MPQKNHFKIFFNMIFITNIKFSAQKGSVAPQLKISCLATLPFSLHHLEVIVLVVFLVIVLVVLLVIVLIVFLIIVLAAVRAVA